MKNQKGITLVALVITIVVLLILAGVTISMVMGDNGVLSNSQKAKEESATGTANDSLSSALSSISTNYYAAQSGNGATTNVSENQAQLNNCDTLADVLKDSTNLTAELASQMPSYKEFAVSGTKITFKEDKASGAYSFEADISNTLTIKSFKNTGKK